MSVNASEFTDIGIRCLDMRRFYTIIFFLETTRRSS